MQVRQVWSSLPTWLHGGTCASSRWPSRHNQRVRGWLWLQPDRWCEPCQPGGKRWCLCRAEGGKKTQVSGTFNSECETETLRDENIWHKAFFPPIFDCRHWLKKKKKNYTSVSVTSDQQAVVLETELSNSRTLYWTVWTKEHHQNKGPKVVLSESCSVRLAAAAFKQLILSELPFPAWDEWERNWNQLQSTPVWSSCRCQSLGMRTSLEREGRQREAQLVTSVGE